MLPVTLVHPVAWLQAAIGLGHAIATLGGFWWTVIHDESISTRWA